MPIFHSNTNKTTPDLGYEIEASEWNQGHYLNLTLTGNTVGQSTYSGTNLLFAGGPNVTLSLAGNTLSFSGGAGAAGNTGYISAGTTNASLGTVSFLNANGVSFGVNGQTLTATVKTDYLTTAALSNHSHGFSAGGGSSAFQTLSFANSNGVSFSNSNGSVVGSVATNYAASDHSHGNPTLALTNLSGTTASNSAGLTLSLSANAPGGGAFSGGVSNLGNTQGQTGVTGTRLVFVGTNNITLSQATDANGGTISISGGAGAAGNTGYLSAGTTNASLGTISVADGNGVSFGINGQTLTATVKTDYLTTAALSNHSHGASGQNGSFAFQTLSFSNANGVSFGTSAGNAITASHNALTSQSNQALSGSNGSFTFQTATFGNSNGLSFYTTNGSLVGSYTVPSPETPFGVSAGTQSVSTGTLVFSNSNGITFGMSGSSRITASHNGLTTAAQSDHSHGNPTLALTNLSGTTASASNGFTLSLSANAPGAAAENNNHNLLGAATAGNTTASGSTIGLSGLNVTLSGTNNSQIVISAPATSSLVGSGGISLSTNGSTITISYTGGAGGGFTNSYFNPQDAYMQVVGQQGQNTLHIQPCKAPNVTFDRIMFPIHNTGASNSNGTATVTLQIGIYTNNASTLSLLTSWSGSQSYHNNSQNSSSLFRGIRLVSVPVAGGYLLTEGQYWAGVVSSTTINSNNQSLSQVLASQMNSNFSGIPGASIANSNQYTRGLGRYSATTGAIPDSIPFSAIYGTESNILRQPIFYFLSGTV